MYISNTSKYPAACVQLNGCSIVASASSRAKHSPNNNTAWTGPYRLRVNDTISFTTHPDTDQRPILECRVVFVGEQAATTNNGSCYCRYENNNKDTTAGHHQRNEQQAHCSTIVDRLTTCASSSSSLLKATTTTTTTTTSGTNNENHDTVINVDDDASCVSVPDDCFEPLRHARFETQEEEVYATTLPAQQQECSSPQNRHDSCIQTNHNNTNDLLKDLHLARVARQPRACLKDLSRSRETGHDESTLPTKKRPRLLLNRSDKCPFGTFQDGTSIYRNSLNDKETFTNGHVTFSNLVLPHCHSIVATTFDATQCDVWLHELLETTVTQLIVVVHDPHAARVGVASLSSMSVQRPGWFWMRMRPHSNNMLLHAKLVLFRSHSGLRLVICGSNLNRGQWCGDRDVLWVQDFMLQQHPHGEEGDNRDGDAVEFEYRLKNFLYSLMECNTDDDQRVVNRRLDEIFHQIDFSTAQAQLVVSFPRPSRSNRERGGWQQLADTVATLLRHNDVTVQDNECMVHAMAGSFGNLGPDFLLQMRYAMKGEQRQFVRRTSWNEVDGIRCLWPSTETSKRMLLGSARAIPKWFYNTIPIGPRRKIFHDAPPNPVEPNPTDLYPFSHSKAMIVTGGPVGIVYVGSHNLSKKAWGLRNAMPQNIELGIVLVSKCPLQRQEWRSRLPCSLPNPQDRSPLDYMPGSEHTSALEELKRLVENGHEGEDPALRKFLMGRRKVATFPP